MWYTVVLWVALAVIFVLSYGFSAMMKFVVLYLVFVVVMLPSLIQDIAKKDVTLDMTLFYYLLLVDHAAPAVAALVFTLLLQPRYYMAAVYPLAMHRHHRLQIAVTFGSRIIEALLFMRMFFLITVENSRWLYYAMLLVYVLIESVLILLFRELAKSRKPHLGEILLNQLTRTVIPSIIFLKTLYPLANHALMLIK